LVHIQKHLIEYEKIGFTVIDYIRFVCSNFNQIRRSKNEKYKFDMIDLVYKNGLAKVVHIKLTTTPEGYWSVSTGYPINFKRIDKNTELLWERKK